MQTRVSEVVDHDANRWRYDADQYEEDSEGKNDGAWSKVVELGGKLGGNLAGAQSQWQGLQERSLTQAGSPSCCIAYVSR